MNTDNLLLLEELLDNEIASLEEDLANEISGRDFLIALKVSTDKVDLTISTITAMLATAKDTLTKLTEWSNN
jgi:hypothetical protein